jgi:hypothetical protein
MAHALTTASELSCPDQGMFQTSSTAKLTVAGKPVLRASDASTWKATGCKQTNTNGGETPCVTMTLTSGQLTKLKVGGSAVLGSGAAGTTSGTPKNTLSVQAKQTKLTAT